MIKGVGKLLEIDSWFNWQDNMLVMRLDEGSLGLCNLRKEFYNEGGDNHGPLRMDTPKCPLPVTRKKRMLLFDNREKESQ